MFAVIIFVMKTVGEFVEEAIDLMGARFAARAVVPAAEAIEATAGAGNAGKFVRENWELISFMGLPRAVLPLPLKVSYDLSRIVPALKTQPDAPDAVAFLISETLRTGKMPDVFEFYARDEIIVRNEKLLLPESLISGFLGTVIVHPDNKNETIGDDYWMNISDFKMFISELWGRHDLAERIRRFYLA